jgi:hypothetical protein
MNESFSYAKSILGKELESLTYHDLVNYFLNPRQESNITEYKSYKPQGDIEQKLAGVYQALCAMLNSDGGIVIWGAPEGKSVEGRKEKQFVGQLSPIDRVFEKDYLINKLSDNITPLPNSIKVEIIENHNQCIVVIEVRKSAYAPHQTKNIYYMRLDGQSKPAPHHYIEALFKQVRYPELGGYIRFNRLSSIASRPVLTITIFLMNHSSMINEENVSFRLICDKGIFVEGPNALRSDPDIGLEGHELSKDMFAPILHYGAAPFWDAKIMFNSDELMKNNYEANLILMFGGKKSPMKSTEYTIRLNNLYPSNINDIVIDKKENEWLYEKGMNTGSEAAKVDYILNRPSQR